MTAKKEKRKRALLSQERSRKDCKPAAMTDWDRKKKALSLSANPTEREYILIAKNEKTIKTIADSQRKKTSLSFGKILSLKISFLSSIPKTDTKISTSFSYEFVKRK